MRAWVCHELAADGSGLRFESDWPGASPPGAGEVRLAITAVALNYPDLLMLSGGYQFKPALPFIPGIEASGIITDVGAAVSSDWHGCKVAVGSRSGCLAEAITVPLSGISPAPSGFDDAETAAYGVGALTAHVALVERGRLESGETLLVTGAGGGMGLAAIGVGKALGAYVVAATSDPAKRQAASAAGADECIVIDRETSDFTTLRDSVDVVFDPVGGRFLDAAIPVLRWGGRYLIIGFVGGLPAPFVTKRVQSRSIEIIGVRAGEYGRRDADAGARARAAVHALAEAGMYRPHVGLRLPFEKAAEAFQALASGHVAGKVIIEIG